MTAATTAGAVLRRQGPLEVLAWPALDALGADVLVTTRHGGVSDGGYASLNLALHVGDEPARVLENRRRAAAAAGADLADFVFCEQTHGRGVTVLSAADRGRGTLRRDDAIWQTDAVVTRDPGTVLAVMVADCVPIVLLDPQARVLAGAAPWPGSPPRPWPPCRASAHARPTSWPALVPPSGRTATRSAPTSPARPSVTSARI
jgi:hypothetical protein